MQRTEATRGLGRSQAREIFDDEIRRERREMHALVNALRPLVRALERLGDRVEAGARRGIDDRDRRSNVQRRVTLMTAESSWSSYPAYLRV